MANILPREKQIEVLHHLVEGNTLRSTARLTGDSSDHDHAPDGPVRPACKRYMDAQLRGLTLRHVEVDEIWTFVGKKQARLTPDEKAECHRHRRRVLWTALDQDTKLVASFVVGKRSADNARKLMVDLSHRLVMPKPHAQRPARLQGWRLRPHHPTQHRCLRGLSGGG